MTEVTAASINHMRRTTVYLEPELEMRLKAEARRLDLPVAQLVREVLWERLDRAPRSRSAHAGGFSSGHADTADRTDAVLRETGFGAISQEVPLELLPASA